jgi:hypothetical protein
MPERQEADFLHEIAFNEPSNCADGITQMWATGAESIDWIRSYLLRHVRPHLLRSMASKATLRAKPEGERALKSHSAANQQHFAADVITLGNAHEVDAAGRLGRRSGAAERD